MNDIFVSYHSVAWQFMLTQKQYGSHGQVYGWTTWSVDNGIAHMKWTQF